MVTATGARGMRYKGTSVPDPWSRRVSTKGHLGNKMLREQGKGNSCAVGLARGMGAYGPH